MQNNAKNEKDLMFYKDPGSRMRRQFSHNQFITGDQCGLPWYLQMGV